MSNFKKVGSNQFCFFKFDENISQEVSKYIHTLKIYHVLQKCCVYVKWKSKETYKQLYLRWTKFFHVDSHIWRRLTWCDSSTCNPPMCSLFFMLSSIAIWYLFIQLCALNDKSRVNLKSKSLVGQHFVFRFFQFDSVFCKSKCHFDEKTYRYSIRFIWRNVN